MTGDNSKTGKLIARLSKDKGATFEELMRLTGWQKHSVRGAMAGTLKKKGYVIASEKVDGERRYRITGSAQ